MELKFTKEMAQKVLDDNAMGMAKEIGEVFKDNPLTTLAGALICTADNKFDPDVVRAAVMADPIKFARMIASLVKGFRDVPDANGVEEKKRLDALIAATIIGALLLVSGEADEPDVDAAMETIKVGIQNAVDIPKR